MGESTVVKIEGVRVIQRGGGVATRPLITRANAPTSLITTGITEFPPGEGARMHTHNCDEQVTILGGEGLAEIDGKTTAVGLHDTTYILAGQPHRFENTGDAPMTILWIYTGQEVTRTFADTGETVAHLSSEDLLAS